VVSCSAPHCTVAYIERPIAVENQDQSAQTGRISRQRTASQTVSGTGRRLDGIQVMIHETKQVEVPARKWWQPKIAGAPDVDKTIDSMTQQGLAFLGKKDVTDAQGKTVKYVLTFERE
jgi:hypothetical protein